MSDCETKKAEVLKLRAEITKTREAFTGCANEAFVAFVAKRYPLPEREPLVVKGSDGLWRRIHNGVSQFAAQEKGPWSESSFNFATMRQLVADADAQARERGE